MSQQPPSTTNQLLTLPGLSDTGDADDQGILPPPSPPWWRSRGGIIGIAIALLIIILGGILFSILNRPRPVTYETQPVTQGNLSLTITAVGPLQAGVYNLVFSGSAGSGIIDSINVKVGQSVKKGQVLAELDKTALQDAVNKDQATLQSAQSDLGSAMQSLAQAQTSANAGNASAQTGLSNAQANSSAVHSQGAATVAQAQQTLNSDRTALAATQRSGQASINSAQATLRADQTALNHARTQANAQIAAAQATRTQAINACNSSSSSTGTGTPTPTTGSSNNAACIQAANTTYNQTVATANANVSAAQTKVNSDQQAVNVARATANANTSAAQSKISDDQKALALAQTNASANNTTAQGQINTARGTIGTTTQQGNTSIVSAQSQVIADQGVVKEDQQTLKADQDNLANATLRAPHDGIVTVINGSVGSTPGIPPSGTSTSAASGNTFIQIVDSSTLQVVADVNEADTANLQVGDPATFTVSAFGTRTFPGTVSAISPNGATSSNVTTYPVYIDINMNQLHGARLLPGMTANVTIAVLQRSNVLLIPVNAVNFARLASTSSATSGVPRAISPTDAAAAMDQARAMLRDLEVQNPNISNESPIPAYVLEQGKGGQVIARPVVLGLSDGTNYEVLQGLINGETIIVGVQGSGASNLGGAGGPGGGGPRGG
jgi:HlyD family secretion protein